MALDRQVRADLRNAAEQPLLSRLPACGGDSVKPIRYSKNQVILMVKVAAVYDAAFAKKLEGATLSPEGDFVADVISYFDLKRDEMGGYTWNPR
jgi:hypothetical protein